MSHEEGQGLWHPHQGTTTSMSDHLTGKDRLGGGKSSEIADAEEDFHKSISTLVSTMITEGAKVPGEHGGSVDL